MNSCEISKEQIRLPSVREVINRTIAIIEKEYSCRCSIKLRIGPIDVLAVEEQYAGPYLKQKKLLKDYLGLFPLDRTILQTKIWYRAEDADGVVGKIIAHVNMLMGFDLPNYEDAILSQDLSRYRDGSNGWSPGELDFEYSEDYDSRLPDMGVFGNVHCVGVEGTYRAWRLNAEFSKMYDYRRMSTLLDDIPDALKIVPADKVRATAREWREIFICPVSRMIGAVDQLGQLLVWYPRVNSFVRLPKIEKYFSTWGIIRFRYGIDDETISDMAALAKTFTSYANSSMKRLSREDAYHFDEAKQEANDYDDDIRSFADECGPVNNWPDYD